jgi:c(7)-type cytochrome triheme protein
VNSQQLESRLAGDIDAPVERISESLESRLDYSIGRLEARLSARAAGTRRRPHRRRAVRAAAAALLDDHPCILRRSRHREIPSNILRIAASALARPLLGLLATLALWSRPSTAEYGDVVINNFSDAAGMRPVVFPHWFHRVRFRCKVCHADLGFQFKAGGNQINMLKIIDGQFCGACHNGELAWSVENCNLCHCRQAGHADAGAREHAAEARLPPAPPPAAAPPRRRRRTGGAK